MNLIRRTAGYWITLGVLALGWSFVSLSFDLYLAALVVTIWLTFRAAGWRVAPEAPEPVHTGTDIPCLHRTVINGAWSGTDFGDVPSTGWWVYRHFTSGGALAYVGKTNSPKRRFRQHAESSKVEHEGWVRFELYSCASEEEMDELEKIAILYNDPAFNIERWRLERYLTSEEVLGEDQFELMPA
jgi:hypothetical protein